jgi:ArsR family transcriptional regulator
VSGLGTVHQDTAKVFKAFCDENRLMILELLRSGEKCACVLLEKLDIGQSTLSYHMKILCDAGVVDSRQEGKWTHYRISEKGSRYASELLKALTTLDKNTEENSCCSSKPSA